MPGAAAMAMPEIIKTNILSKIHDDHLKNVTSRVSTRFYFDLDW